jgi:hypothetical protein
VYVRTEFTVTGMTSQNSTPTFLVVVAGKRVQVLLQTWGELRAALWGLLEATLCLKGKHSALKLRKSNRHATSHYYTPHFTSHFAKSLAESDKILIYASVIKIYSPSVALC